MEPLRYLPTIIEFLGYNPLPEGTTLGEQLVRRRTTLGMSQREAAGEIGVDQGTLARWERGERERADVMLGRVLNVLADDGEQRARRAG